MNRTHKIQSSSACHCRVLLLVLLALLCCTSKANAATEKDIQLLSKSIGFVEGGGGKDVAVIFDAGNSKSLADADSVVRLLGGVGLKGTKVPVSNVSGASAKILFVTDGLINNWDAIAYVGASSKKITATMDGDCVKAGKCVLGIQSAPNVEIKLSKSAAQANGVSFGAAFRMMVKEY